MQNNNPIHTNSSLPGAQGKNFRIIFIGDICGRYGRRFLAKALPHIKLKYSPDLTIANGENSAGGLGISRKTAYEIFDAGVDVITGGNHTWDKKEAVQLLEEDHRIIRPLNFPDTAPGKGFYLFKSIDGIPVFIVNIQGRVFMEPVVDNPFTAMNKLLEQEDHKIVFVDFHAEATAEKQAMGFFLEGRVSAILGTHTHVQTSDLRILAGGTAFQTDAGMTGSLDSIIGMKKEPVIQKFLTGVNQRFEVAKDNVIMDFSLIDIEPGSGHATSVRAIRIFESDFDQHLSV